MHISTFLRASSPPFAILWLWGLWYLSWMIAAFWSNRTEGRPKFQSELFYRLGNIIGILLLFAGHRRNGHHARLWHAPLEVRWCLVGIATAGFAFCWWARIHLGRMWSSSVTRKADHHIIDTGPYALVRHPIYTGIIIAAAATAALEAQPVSFIGLVVVTFSFWLKARLEEKFLRRELGMGAYDAYSSRTSMLFPGL